MTRIKADPAATPEENAARVIQNAANTYAERAERFASILERYAGDLDPEARELLETWARRWASRLVNATQPDRPDSSALRLIDAQPGDSAAGEAAL